MEIACLGDSLTEGDYGVYGKSGIANIQKKNYPYFLSKILKCNVKNYGKCGFTSTSYLEYYKSGKVDIKSADTVIIMLGTNGGLSAKEDLKGNQDYIKIIRCCKKDNPNAKIYICTPPHVTENPNKSNFGYSEKVKCAVSFVIDLAKKEKIELIRTDTIPEFTAENEELMQPNDGLHFGKKGYEVLAQFIAKTIQQ